MRVGSQMGIARRRLFYTRLLIGYPSTAVDRRWIQCIQSCGGCGLMELQDRFSVYFPGFEFLLSVKMSAEKGRRPHKIYKMSGH